MTAQTQANSAQIDFETLEKYKFWSVQIESTGEFKSLKIDQEILNRLFYNVGGFRRLDIEETPVFVQLSNAKLIKQIQVVQIQDFLFEFIDNMPAELPADNGIKLTPRAIRKKIIEGISSYFNTSKLYTLKQKEPILFNQDKKDAKFIYFKNGFLKISKNSCKLLDYSKLGGYIWENEIIQHDFIKLDWNESLGVVQNFFWNVCGAKDKRFKDLQIIAGYYTHCFFDTKLKCLVLTDSTIDESGDANGRTGKTLFIRLISGVLSNNPLDSTIKTYVEINGKDFDPKEKHKYSRAALDTKLIHINDLKRGFDVDCLYNDITDGITIDKKGLQPYKIWAKIVLSTNKSLKIEGRSSKDRFLEFEFSDFFSDTHSPEDEYKHWFFRDWNEKQFNEYYNFMAQCAQVYIDNDCRLNEPEQINLNNRKMIESTNIDFIDYLNDLKIVPNKEYNKTELFDNFISRYPDFKNDRFKQRTFSIWLKNYVTYNSEYKNYKKENNETRDASNRYWIFAK